MSRIGKKPVSIPASVKISHDAASRTVKAEGPKGKLAYTYIDSVSVAVDEDAKAVSCSIPEDKMDDRGLRAHWGTTRSRIQNIVTGVSEGFERKLQINGVGWNAQAQGKTLRLNVGYCHPVDLTPPDGVAFDVQNNIIAISGPDKQAVGQFAAVVRSKRPPEPYNGKGIKYLEEVIRRKEGKAFGS
jgi:large subunit ribosomal protein L6